jgi:hypothetical protein
MMIYTKLSLTILVVVSFNGISNAQEPKIRSMNFGGELSYGYRIANELNLGVNMVTVPNLAKKTGCIYSLTYNGVTYLRNYSTHFGQRISFDIGYWRSEMKIGLLPHLGLFIESREAFNLCGGVSCGISILNFICLNYKYTFTKNQTTLPISNHALSVIVKLNFTTIDLAWYKIGPDGRKR